MKDEVQCGCDFLSSLLATRHLPTQFTKPFKRRMEELLMERFRDHWDPSNPNKGSAYRCIRINGRRLDPVVKEAAKVTGLSNIAEYLPSELTLWIDPNDVSYRFGEDGSICSCNLPSPSHPVLRSQPAFASPAQTTTPVATRLATPSPVKRSGSSPVKYNTSPMGRSASPPNATGSRYYMSQVYDTFSRLDYAIPVHV